MKRGGFGQEASDQPHPTKFTELSRVLHWVTRVVIGIAFTVGGIAGMFLWDWRYVAAGLLVVLGGLMVGPWVPPMPPHYVPEEPRDDWNSDGVSL